MREPRYGTGGGATIESLLARPVFRWSRLPPPTCAAPARNCDVAVTPGQPTGNTELIDWNINWICGEAARSVGTSWPFVHSPAHDRARHPARILNIPLTPIKNHEIP